MRIVICGRQIRADGRGTHDQSGQNCSNWPIARIRLRNHVSRYLRMMPIIQNAVVSAPLRFPVIFDSPIRPR